MKSKLSVVAVRGLIGMILATVPAMADYTLTLTIDNCSGIGACGGGPFGTIAVTQDGANTVKIDTELVSGIQFITSGFGGSLVFNILGNPTIATSNFSDAKWTLLSTTAGSVHMDGFGNFDYAIVCPSCTQGGGHPQGGSLIFDVTATGLTPASFLELSTGGTQVYFAADVVNNPPNGNTGAVGALGSTQVPEPASILLFGGVLLGIGAWRRSSLRRVR